MQTSTPRASSPLQAGRGESAPPPDIEDPFPITKGQLLLAAIVVALACWVSSVFPLGFAPGVPS